MAIWKPRVVVAAVIESEGRFLFVEEIAGGRLVLNQPAGHLDPGESLLQAVVREVREETGCDFTPTALVAVYRYPNPIEDDTFIRFAFAGRAGARDPGASLDPDIVRPVWLTPAELDARRGEHRSPLVARTLADYLAGARHDLSLLADVVE
ncbi:MAG: NUDIX hydrolase [Gammaproteobacteria bacterium]